MAVSIKDYQSFEIDNLITEMRLLTDWSDETIYDEIVNNTKLTEDEQDMLAERLGIL